MEQESTALPVFYRTMLGTSFFFLELPGCTVQIQALPLKNQKVGDPTVLSSRQCEELTEGDLSYPTLEIIPSTGD